MQAILNTKFCANHQPAPIRPAATPEDADTQIVNISQVPATRPNEVATSLLSAVKALQADNALKVRLRKFSKPTLTCTKRYARVQGLRIGVRFVGEWAYLWKMTEMQIKTAEQRAARLVAARAKKGKK